MERSALTNGNQRRTALDVALSNGITSAQFTDLCTAAVQHVIPGLGTTATLRLQNIRHLIRQGLVTRDSVVGYTANLRSYPADDGTDSVMLMQIAEIITVMSILADDVGKLGSDVRNLVTDVHRALMPYVEAKPDVDGSAST